MTPETRLLRQIHPSFIQSGRVTSQAFRPTPKDDFFLSVDNGDNVCPEQSWRRFTSNPACRSSGVLAIIRMECTEQELPVIEDGHPHPEHCSIDYSAFDKRAIEKRSKLLRSRAADRGWLYKDAGL